MHVRVSVIVVLAALSATTLLGLIAPRAGRAATGCTYGIPPAVATSAAASITQSGATVKGTVNPGACATTYYFQYGTTSAYGKTTAQQTVAAGSSAVSVSAALTGLSVRTSYHFRLVATNSVGTVSSADRTFSTQSACVPGGDPLPGAATSKPTSITGTTAVLHGTVTPNGCSTTYHFDYGPTTAYGQATPNTTVTANTSAKPTLTGLNPGETYHVRLVAASGVGTTNGSDVTFTTTSSCQKKRPAVSTVAPSSVSENSATFAGMIATHGCTTTYSFEYGRTTAYGNTTKATTIPGQSSTASGVASVSGLRPDTVYHVRLVASNSTGTTAGNDVTFTTSRRSPSALTIGKGPVTVHRRYRAKVRLSCSGGTGHCAGVLRVFDGRRSIGSVRFNLAPGNSRLVSLHFTGAGRTAIAGHARLKVTLRATYGTRSAHRGVTLLRRL